MTCVEGFPVDDTVNDQYIVNGVTFMMWGPGLICSIMIIWALTITCSLREKFDLLTAVFAKYSSSQDDDLRLRFPALKPCKRCQRGQPRSHHLLRHREEPDGEVVFDCA